MASDFKGFGDPRKDVHWHGERILFHSDFSQCLQIPELSADWLLGQQAGRIYLGLPQE
jgi:hypothetical protein